MGIFFDNSDYISNFRIIFYIMEETRKPDPSIILFDFDGTRCAIDEERFGLAESSWDNDAAAVSLGTVER